MANSKQSQSKRGHLWAEAKRHCRLTREDVRIAKESGLDPRSLIKNNPSQSQQWKLPVKQWSRELCEKRKIKAPVGRRPDVQSPRPNRHSPDNLVLLPANEDEQERTATAGGADGVKPHAVDPGRLVALACLPRRLNWHLWRKEFQRQSANARDAVNQLITDLVYVLGHPAVLHTLLSGSLAGSVFALDQYRGHGPGRPDHRDNRRCGIATFCAVMSHRDQDGLG
jgi:hypothetical protein